MEEFPLLKEKKITYEIQPEMYHLTWFLSLEVGTVLKTVHDATGSHV